ncbi:CHRD domain-containing protein [Brachybacterium halotolerans subsp. kimchii]|uniref:CHRD domain-containing protein n=1 Tax=Brachybacterium halotolerans TaxID=2795215 RepID=UPI001E493877|nr:CHRD domain-containing protein [Brachybacterium halotolerans]UEJ81727.1 CHRD domain-containing protein [Brachybacterium halotolerans subsp. kimchii]
MRKTMKSISLMAATMAAVGFGATAPALAEGSDAHSYQANLTELNDSGASGTAWLTLDGDQLTVKMDTKGLLEGSPHAQHIHIGGKGKCPDPNMKGSGENGAIQVSDAMDDYGMIGTSLTTKGGTGPDNGLDVANFPTGDGHYERTITVSDDVASSLKDGKAVVVVHGVDHNGSGKYDGDTKSDLDPSLPSEATDPAACGAVTVSQMSDMPQGGVETGDGTTAGIEDAGLLAAGGALVTAGVVGAVVSRRRSARTEK